MKCPSCGFEMIIGYYGFKSNMLDFIAFGLSASDLYFLNDQYENKLVMTRGEKLEGYFCNNCFTKVILNNEPTDLSDPKITT